MAGMGSEPCAARGNRPGPAPPGVPADRMDDFSVHKMRRMEGFSGSSDSGTDRRGSGLRAQKQVDSRGGVEDDHAPRWRRMISADDSFTSTGSRVASRSINSWRVG